MNIVFSTTRQWNPGDEFIMLGCQNLIRKVIGPFNSIIYNRNPQTRRARKYDFIKIVDNFLGKDFVEKFLDNSVKDRLPMNYADLVVFAGSPEWRGRRMTKLYDSIAEFNVPAIFMGLGTSGEFEFNSDYFTEGEMAAFNKSKLITCRDSSCHDALKVTGSNFLPCPALFSSNKQKLITDVKKIALIYGTSSASACNNVSVETHNYLLELYRNLMSQFGREYEFEFVAHYIDELNTFDKDFPNQKLNYSYDAKDYLEIYGKFDYVIGYRVHGIGISASQGIPGMMIAHDPRASTVKGFLAQIVETGTPVDQVIEMVKKQITEVESCSRLLLEHKEKTEQKYIKLLQESLSDFIAK
tara:strand:- start:337 stop:1401 length:1065 start_codon:yes stop_codon:yes gene_type:complete